MFREEVYNAISKEFAVSVGVAQSIRGIDPPDPAAASGDRSPAAIRRLEREFADYRTQVQLHGIINRAIRTGRYPELMRKVLCGGKGAELTRYRRAWREIVKTETDICKV
jgi:hypothetical protein